MEICLVGLMDYDLCDSLALCNKERLAFARESGLLDLFQIVCKMYDFFTDNSIYHTMNTNSECICILQPGLC